MTRKVYVVTDLGPGDGGKGGVVHKIATMKRAHTIVKVGGAQGSHGVCTSRGERFAFSQWGCGTFEGIRTHITDQLVVSPEGLLNEANVLRYQHGIHDPFSLLTADERALCATPYHGIASRLKELARGGNPRGTIGTGVGEAYRFAERFPELTIRVCDLSQPGIRERLAAVREQVQHDLEPLTKRMFLPDDQAIAAEEISLLGDDGFLDYIKQRFREVTQQLKVVTGDFLRTNILGQNGNVVVESSHGVLTDRYHGFHPHTSALRTLPRFTRAMLEEAGYDGPVVNIGVTRAYQIRHGAGPMPTADPAMNERLLPDSHKEENRYQGKVRVGPLDLVLLRYAIACCGGPKVFNGLAITWFDQIQRNRTWQVCNRYTETDALPIHFSEDAEQLRHQEELGQKLFTYTPEIETIRLPQDADRDALYALCNGVLQERLGIPVRMISFGPTERDKMCK